MYRCWLVVTLAATAVAAGTRLPRTSQPASSPAQSTAPRLPQRNFTISSRSTVRNREQYIFNVFEVIVSTLETKLQRIENLDKAVEHLMRRVEALDSRVNDNIHKTDAIISKLGNLDVKLFSRIYQGDDESSTENINNKKNEMSDAKLLDKKLESLDQKVSGIDTKLIGLKTQIDNNFLPVDDINAEASEKKPINLNVIEIAKSLNTEVINEITKEVDQLRTSMSTVDRKLQFHINLVSENLGKVLYMMADVHAAIVEPESASININGLFKNRTTTSTPSPATKASKIDTLVNKIIPMMSVSEKMDEVWDVVVGTKSSVDDLVPKSDELLTQTQRQERAIGQIHNDLRLKTNLIIENLDMVEKRLKKQEDDVATLAQRPVPAELLLDPTIDRLVEYAPNRYKVDELLTEPTTNAPVTTQASSTANISPSSPSNVSASSTSATVTVTPAAAGSGGSASNSGAGPTSSRPSSRKGGIIFPSVKNKPIIGNNTFASEIVANYKDVKGYSCVDLLNAGMRESGVYYLQIRGTTYWFLKVFCEQNVADGGWTVIHRRDDFGIPAENFNRDWSDYKNGFGDPNKEFWLGNENIYMLTNNDDYMLRVELEDFDGNKRYAQYSHFKIYSEAEYYKLEIDGYDGNAGDSLNDPWYGSNNSPFSTYNRDNDRSSLNCASMLKGGWWWKSCGRGLNGLYLHDPQDLTARQGIVWFRWRGWDYTLKRASMMIKPKGLLPNT
ncbi:angiopoietin-related protein 2 isoform X1 [Danaus plexippus]|uniref:angiopoietin-related protein 2 isoform X1 n=2 Tax=Danaus plexippus TaxID=13037 RepID=UPI002AB31C44|nr:angiopoietin-related protein 2 isoform X1 [Danaus plexippus]